MNYCCLCRRALELMDTPRGPLVFRCVACGHIQRVRVPAKHRKRCIQMIFIGVRWGAFKAIDNYRKAREEARQLP